MKRIAIIIYLAFVSAAWSQIVDVRSGDHAGFTRVTMSLPKNTEYEVHSEPQKISILFDLDSANINLKKAFQRISRKRVSDIQINEGGTGLWVFLSCTCVIRSFEVGDLLVVDISDRDPKPVISTSVGRDVLDQGAGATALQVGERLVLPEYYSLKRTTVRTPESEKYEVRQNVDEADGLQEKRLLEKIAVAASSGILVSNTDILAAELDSNNLGGRKIPAFGMVRSHEIRSDLDELSSSSVLAREEEQYCYVDYSLPGQPKQVAEYFTELARLRGSLGVELDADESIEILRKLAKTYLLLGFGSEARKILETVPTDHENVILDVAISTLLMAENLENENPLVGRESCDGDISLWAFLSGYRNNRDLTSTNARAVIFAFQKIPVHTRVLIGSELINAFSRLGDSESSLQISRILSRASVLGGVAKNTSERGDNLVLDEETPKLQGFGGGDESVLMPEVLMKRIARHWKEQKALGIEAPSLLSSFVWQNDFSDQSDEMSTAILHGFLLAGNYPQALASLLEMEHLFESPKKIWGEFLIHLSENGNDETFMEYVVDDTILKNQYLEPKVAHSVVARLVDLGFAELALEILRSGPTNFEGAEFDLLRGRAHELLGDLAVVQRVTGDLSGVEALKLRAQVFERSGQYAAAAEIYQVLSMPEDLARVEELAGDLRVLSGGLQGQLSAEEGRPLAVQGSDLDLLSRSEDVLEGSGEFREALLRFVEGFARP